MAGEVVVSGAGNGRGVSVSESVAARLGLGGKVGAATVGSFVAWFVSPLLAAFTLALQAARDRKTSKLNRAGGLKKIQRDALKKSFMRQLYTRLPITRRKVRSSMGIAVVEGKCEGLGGLRTLKPLLITSSREKSKKRSSDAKFSNQKAALLPRCFLIGS
jgi:hypothetical protein